LTRQRIDFNYVPPEHRAIDERLHNWGLWCKNPESIGICPMFRNTPSPPRVRAESDASLNRVDSKDAESLQASIRQLAITQQSTLSWAYVHRSSISAQCKKIGVDMRMLQMILNAARTRLVAITKIAKPLDKAKNCAIVLPTTPH